MTDPQRYRYDVFVSYSQSDHEWVWEWLLPQFEAAGLSVCLDNRCFELGAPRATETERVIKESRRIVAVLSPAWAASQWDVFEALLVHADDPAASGRRLIPLLLQPCDPPERIKLLQWVDVSDPAQQERQIGRVIAAIQGKAALPELRPETAFPSPKQRRSELRWYAVAGVAAVLTLILVGWLIWNTIPKRASAMPDGFFNIAVAPFEVIDTEGQLVDDDTGYQQSANIARFLNSEAAALAKVYGKQFGDPVNIWGVDELDIPVVTDANAEAVLDKKNARILIYGKVVQLATDKWQLVPSLYFSDESVEHLAAELRGPQAMGAPIPYYTDLAGNPNLILNERMSALAHLLLGLVLYGKGDRSAYEGAVAAFEAGTETEWGSEKGDGQEILYLFLGNAQGKAASLETTDPEKHRQLLEKSEGAYRNAIRLNPTYPRAYNGLGGVLFQQARGNDCTWDWDILEEAYRQYQKALESPYVAEPTSGDVVIRSELGMGRVRFWQGLCPNSGWRDETLDPWEEAVMHYNKVLETYEQAPNVSRYIAAMIAYTDYGSIWLEAAKLELDAGDMSPDEVSEYLLSAVDNYKSALTVADQAQNEEASSNAIAIKALLAEAECLYEHIDATSSLEECVP